MAKLDSEAQALREAEGARRDAESAARASAAETEHLAIKVCVNIYDGPPLGRFLSRYIGG